jgi:transposase-like protein
MRKTHTPNEKARIVLEALQGERTLQEIASANNIHPGLLTRWKTQANKERTNKTEKSRDKRYKKIYNSNEAVK